jgi:hypothetical protein
MPGAEGSSRRCLGINQLTLLMNQSLKHASRQAARLGLGTDNHRRQLFVIANNSNMGCLQCQPYPKLRTKNQNRQNQRPTPLVSGTSDSVSVAILASSRKTIGKSSSYVREPTTPATSMAKRPALPMSLTSSRLDVADKQVVHTYNGQSSA